MTTEVIDDDDGHLYDCLVVGGGISGCTLAHNLYASHDLDVLLCESNDRLGGNVRSVTVEDEDGSFLYEDGPNSFETSPSIMRISRELNMEDEMVFAPEGSVSPWIYHGGKVHPLPTAKGKFFGPGGMMRFILFGDLLSWRGKTRAFAGAFLGHAPPPVDGGEETIEDFAIRTLGEEAFHRMIEPIVSGVYCGDPSRLSARSTLPKFSRMEEKAYDLGWNKFGALFYGGLAIRRAESKKSTAERREEAEDAPSGFEYGRPGSYRTGLAALPNAIAVELGTARVRLRWTLTNVEKDVEGRSYVATFDTPDHDEVRQRTVRARTVILTIPAHAIRAALDKVLPGSAELFSRERRDSAAVNSGGVSYPPVASVTLSYPKSSFRDVELADRSGSLRDLPGFGVVSTRSSGVRTLSTLFSSSHFPGRCPDGCNLLSNTIGGTRDPAVGAMSDDDLVSVVDEDLRKILLRPDAPPPKVLGVKAWPRAIPQYELGHSELLTELKRMEDANDGGGLWVCGNYRTGVSFVNCVNFGYEHAKVVAGHLSSETKMINEAPSLTQPP
jgi:oxygen-dependent protoporphyrinogen oxidase